MGLLDMLNKGGGLFDPIAQSSERGFDLQKMMANTEPPAPPQFAPPQEQGRGGVFGSGYSGEDIMSMLLRAAAIAQGDLGAGAQFGANIGAKARAEAEAAQAERLHQQRRMEGREDQQWGWENKPNELEGFDAELVRAGIDPRSPQGMQLKQQKVNNTADPWVQMTTPDGRFLGGPRSQVMQSLSGGQQPTVLGSELPPGWTIEGGGTGNGVGGFRR